MTGTLPPNASVAAPSEGDKLCAPAAGRNADVLCDMLRTHAPENGSALEIASGTGQHVVAFAHHCPGLLWHPTEIDTARLRSIDAYRAETVAPNVKPAQLLDATQVGWHATHSGQSLILVINLLHLIRRSQAQVLLHEALAALKPGGRFILYGPFKRDGALTSDEDKRFDAQLRGADPAIGYKDDQEITKWLEEAGAQSVQRKEMPANNLAVIATR